MKHLLLLFIFAPLLRLLAERPNIVIIFTDDLGINDIGAYTYPTKPTAWPAAGPPPILPSHYTPLPQPNEAKNLTPHIDSLAADGLKMTSFYSASPACSPSRAALLTGCHATRMSIERVVLPEPFTDNIFGLHPEEVTLPERLREQGYLTALSGKWHLGEGPDFNPLRHGFDEFFGIPHSNDIWSGHPSQTWPDLPLLVGEQPLEGNFTTASGGVLSSPIDTINEQRHLMEAFTEHSLAFMKDAVLQEKPFFLFYASHAPHTPCYPHPDFIGASGVSSFYDVMAELDHRVGQLLDKLDELGVADDTLVIFTSDNGPWHQRNDRTLPQQAVGSAYPYRGAKRDDLEGGLRMPFLARFPGKIPAGHETDALGAMMDLMPTLLGLAGTEMPSDRETDGVDLWPLWINTPDLDPPRAEFHYYPVGATNATGLREGRWKRLGNALYDLENDPQESNNVAGQHPGIHADLGNRLQTWNTNMQRRPKGLPLDNRIEVEADRVTAPLDGTIAIRVRLAQPANLTVTASPFSGNPDVTLDGTDSLTFTNANYDQWQSFHFQAAPEAGQLPHRGATFRLQANGLHLREVLVEHEAPPPSAARQAYWEWIADLPEGEDPSPEATRGTWSNLLRFALGAPLSGMSPPDFHPGIFIGKVGSESTFGMTFRVLPDTEPTHPLTANGLTYEVMVTETLEAWPENSPGFSFQTQIPDPAQPEKVRVRVIPESEVNQVFMKLMIRLQ
ncbi:MAG: sulfatase-like hydrolase/transferase [Verrucomicrobia bacterium]|nr:sulfatase-like hydrolase/transferase [Verrucomicrobiota bacterium]